MVVFYMIVISYSDDLTLLGKKIKKNNLLFLIHLDNNDMRFATNQGFNTGDHFYSYLKR